MRFSDSIQYRSVIKSKDKNGDIVETYTWNDLGKCIIFPNTAAKKQTGNDTEQRVYSYEIIMRVPKSYLPKEDDWIHITKKDGSIDEKMQVIGFVTLNGRYLKLWV